MAAVKGVNVTKYDAGGQGDNSVDQGLIHTQPEVWTDTYEASGLVAGSTIDVAVLPANSKVLLVEVYFDALGGSSTLQLGDTDDPNRYIVAASSATAGKLESNLVNGKNYVIGTATGDEIVQILTAGATINGTIKTTILYTR